MTWRVIVRPLARLEIAEAIDWYNAQVDGLGDQFLGSVRDSLAMVQRNPLQYQVLQGPFRRARLRRFPYILIYRLGQEEIVVMRCIHGHSDPSRWLTGH
jgi:toxin ParE1/3/4